MISCFRPAFDRLVRYRFAVHAGRLIFLPALKNPVMRQLLWLLTGPLLIAGSLMAQPSWEVYVFVAEECPISIYMTRPLQQAWSELPGQVGWNAVFPNEKSDFASSRKFLREHGLEAFTVHEDQQQQLARRLGATVTPEVVVTDPLGRVAYRGRISDAFSAPGRMKHGPRKNELLEVLQRLLRHETVLPPWPAAVGCYISFSQATTDGP